MKKDFFKKLSFVLAFAMVATTVAPVGSASAAATPNLAKRFANVYEGNSYSYAVKNAKGYTVKWVVSGKGAKYASVSKTTGAKTVLSVDTNGAAAAKNAPVVVTAKFYKGKKLVKTAGDGVVVKVSATAVDITTKADVTKVPAGEAVKFSRKITPANATSVTYWSVTDKDGKATTKATIDKTGNLTVTELGDYVVVAEVKNSKTGKAVAKDTQEVKAILAIKSAAQDTVKKLAVTFNSKVPETVKATDFSIVKDSDNRAIAVDEIKIDGTKVTVTTYQKINDGASYTVKYLDSTFAFVASNNTVSSIVISPATITKNKLTTIKVATKDANGVELDSYDFGKEDKSKIDFSIETTNGYVAGSDLLLNKVGDTAKAKATYHTNKYDEKGAEVGKITTELTITAVDKIAAIDNSKYTIDDENPDWDDVKINTKLAVEDTSYFIYFTAEDADDNKLTEYKLKSSDSNYLLVGSASSFASAGQSKVDTIAAPVTAVKDGTAYVLVQDDDDNTITSLPVTIVAKRKATNMTLGTYFVQLSTAVADTKEVDVETFDQFGDEMEGSIDDVISVECLDAPANTIKGAIYTSPATTTHLTIASGSDKVVFNGGASVTAGTYKYKVKAGGDEGITRTIEVKVSTPDSQKASRYALVISDGTVDTKMDKIGDMNKTVTFKLAEFKGDVVLRYVPINTATISIDGPDNNDPALKATAATAGDYEVSTDTVTYYARFANAAAKAASKDANGTYKFAVTVPGSSVGQSSVANVVFSAQFTVKDTQAAVTFAMDKQETDVASSFEAAILDAFDFYYDGDEILNPVISNYKMFKAGSAEFNMTNAPAVITGQSYWVKEVTVDVTLKAGTADEVTVPVTVQLNNSSILIK